MWPSAEPKLGRSVHPVEAAGEIDDGFREQLA
jgi:hypothetical protein